MKRAAMSRAELRRVEVFGQVAGRSLRLATPEEKCASSAKM